MRIELNKENNRLTINGEADLVFTRLTYCRDTGLYINADGSILDLKYMNLVNLYQSTRLGRFLFGVRFLWRHCK